MFPNANENSYLNSKKQSKAFHHILLQFTTHLSVLILILSATECLQLPRPSVYKPVYVRKVWEVGLLL